MPATHKHFAEFTEEKALKWALDLGQATHDFMEVAMTAARKGRGSFRIFDGMKKLNLEYGQERIEQASIKCLGIGATQLRSIRSILKTNLDRTISKNNEDEADFEHKNIRGSKYYN